MKVRHFGPPQKAQAPGTPAPGATAAESKTQDAKKPTAEVTLEAGALQFPRVEGLAESAKIDRARALLATLRAPGGDAFGGKVKGGVDVVTTLKSYFRALELTPLARAIGGDEAVSRFVASLDVPEDIRPLVALATGDVSSGGSLGSNATWERAPDASAMWAEWRRQADPDALRVTDATVKAFFGRWGMDADFQSLARSQNSLQLVGLFKLFARAKELGLDVVPTQAAAYAQSLPATASSAAVLQRFANAFALDPQTLSVGNRTLPQWQGLQSGVALGDVSTWEADSNAWHMAVRRGDARAFEVTDKTLDLLINDGYTSLSYWLEGPSETHLSALKGFERLARLGIVESGSIEDSVSHLEGSKDVARTLQRIARACDTSLDHITLGGKSLAEWSSGKTQTPSLGPKKPLGAVRTWENEPRYDALYNVVHQSPRQTMAISDATLQKWFGAWGPNQNLPDYAGDGTPESRVAYALWWARAKELGLRALCPAGGLENFAATMPQSAEAANALRRLGRAFGFAVEHLSVGGRSVSSFTRPRARQANDAPRELPQRAPLGDTKMLKPDLQAALSKKDAALFAIDDGSLKRLIAFDTDLTAALGASRDRAWRLGVLSLAERALAIGAIDATAVQALVQSTPLAMCEDAAMSLLVATLVVKAAVPADALTFSTGEPLSASPETAAHVSRLERVLEGVDAEVRPRRTASVEARRNDELVREQSLVADLGMLAPQAKTRGTNGGAAHPSEREAAVLHLLGVTNADAPVVHELTEILPRALQALQSGELKRIDLSRLPEKHKHAMLATAFQSHDHPAAVALLAGLFFEVDAASIERTLLGQGHLPHIAQEMGALAAQLAKASASALAFCTLGLAADPPELASLPLRAWMLTAPEPAELAAKIKSAPDLAASLCAMILEEATRKDTPGPRRTALVDVVTNAEKLGQVDRGAVVELLSDPACRMLDADAIAGVQAAVAPFLDARTEAEKQAARTTLENALAQETWTRDPNLLASAAFDVAAAHDLKFIASLRAVDAKGSGVIGKAWESRLPQKGARAEVAGVKLPVEAKGGRAPRVKAPAYPSVEGSTAEIGLRLVATRWLAQRPFCIDDVNGAAAVRTLAQATGARVTEIVVSKDSALESIVGAEGALGAALAEGGVAHLSLHGDVWPPGLVDALTAAHGADARVVATGPALPGVPTLKLPALEEDALHAHAEAHDLTNDHAAIVAGLLVALSARVGAALPLSLIERVGARMSLIREDGNYVNLQRAVAQVAGGMLPGSKAADLTYILRQHINASEDGANFSIERRSARLGDVPLKIVAPGVTEADLPVMTDAERVQLRGAAWALEVKEPVLGDAATIERVGVAYGAITGRDVHVHLMWDGCKPSDVLSASVGDVVIVAHGFSAAPKATQEALLNAAREGRVRLLIEDGRGVIAPDAFSLGSADPIAGADGAAQEESFSAMSARARDKGRLLGLPDVVSDGMCTVIDGIARDVKQGELEPLMQGDPARQLENLMDLFADLSRVLPLQDAFVSAVSATFPMRARDQQDKIERDARAVVS